MPSEPALLHLYPQDLWHFPAYVVGNRAGLYALREAITEVLDRDRTRGEAVVMAGDGEGYELTVIRDDTTFYGADADTWGRWAVPYTDEIARESREHAWHPDGHWPPQAPQREKGAPDAC